MGVVPCVMVLLLGAFCNAGALKYRASASKGLTDITRTRNLDFFIPAGSCSAEITNDLFGDNCHDPEYVFVEILDDLITDIIHVNDSLTEASIWRHANKENGCPNEAPVVVKVMCNHNRRSDYDPDEKFPRRQLKPARVKLLKFGEASKISPCGWSKFKAEDQ